MVTSLNIFYCQKNSPTTKNIQLTVLEEQKKPNPTGQWGHLTQIDWGGRRMCTSALQAADVQSLITDGDYKWWSGFGGGGQELCDIYSETTLIRRSNFSDLPPLTPPPNP